MTNKTAKVISTIASFVFAAIYIFTEEPFFMMMALLQAIHSTQYAIIEELEKGRE